FGRPKDDPDTYQALKIVPSSGAQTILWTSKFDATGQNPSAIEVDGASNAYILLDNPPAVVRIPAGGGPPNTIDLAGILPSESPSALAVDASGNNVYLSDGWTGLVVKAPLNGDPPVSIGYVGTGFSSIAVDADGNVYGTDLWDDRVIMIKVGSGRQVTV